MPSTTLSAIMICCGLDAIMVPFLPIWVGWDVVFCVAKSSQLSGYL